MTKITDIPAIRFKGFSDTWEQRKLSEIATMHARIGWQNLRTSEFLDSGDYMLITGTDFIDGAVNFDTCHYVERERYEQDKHIQIRNGSILITKDGTLGKVAYIQGLTMPATLNAGVFNVEIKDENEVDNRYLFQYLKAPFLMNYVDKKATGGTIKHLNQNILIDFPVVLPHKAEQEKIGEYFLAIDHLITLHQREFAFLCKEKSKKFRYIKNAWEQRKLGELALFNPKDELPQTFEYVDLESVVGTEMLSHRTEIKSSAPSRAQRLACTGDIFYQTVRPYQKNNYLFEISDNNYVFSTGYAQMRPFVDGYFLFSLIQSERFVKVVLDNCTGTSYPAINVNDLAKIEVAVPSGENEAHKIGTIFRSLDHLITLHQRELEKLKNLKKACLEKMFV